MKKYIHNHYRLIILLLFFGCCLWFCYVIKSIDHRPIEGPKNPNVHGRKVNSSSSVSKVEEETTKVLINDFLKTAGYIEISPLGKELKEIVESSSKDKISLAFQDAVYSRKWLMGEVIPELKSYLNHSDPFVRYSASKSLYIVGDNSGYETLIDILKGNTDVDLRISAAKVLGKYRQHNAAEIIFYFYKENPKSGLVSSLLKLNVNVQSEVEEGHFRAEGIRGYTLAGAKKFIPQINTIFTQSTKPEQKLTAAWGLAVMNGDETANKYLFDQAKALLSESPPVGNASNLGCDALKYIATNRSEEVKHILEKALDNKNSQVVQIAIVNLIFNQGGSAKANQVIAQRLKSPGGDLPLEFILNIATQLLDDPSIQAAGNEFKKNDSAGFWKLYTEERKNWSIYNWVDDYVIKFNDTK